MAPQKKLLLVMIAFAGCSSPKYTYHFDKYREFSGAVPNVSEASLSPTTAPVASIEVKPAIFEHNTVEVATSEQSIVNYRNERKIRREQRKEVKSMIRSYIKHKEGVDSISAKKDASKNGFAIAGFVCSLVGLFLVWPLCLLGVIFSAIGLNSERRGLATAGLIIGIVGVVLILVAGAIVASAL